MWLNECPSVPTRSHNSRDGSRWRIVGRRTAGHSHVPSRHSLPHSWSFRAPPRAVCHWPVRRHVWFSVATALRAGTVTAECGCGRGNKQNSWGEISPFDRLCLQRIVCRAIYPRFVKMYPAEFKALLKGLSHFCNIKSMFSRSLSGRKYTITKICLLSKAF